MATDACCQDRNSSKFLCFQKEICDPFDLSTGILVDLVFTISHASNHVSSMQIGIRLRSLQ